MLVRSSPEGQFGLKTAGVVFASARPVIMAIFFSALSLCFTSLRIFAGGRPMAAPTAAYFKKIDYCRGDRWFLRYAYLENGAVTNSSAGHNRDTAIMKFSILNANRPCASTAGRRLRQQNRLQLAALQGGLDGLGDEGKVRGEGSRFFHAVVLLKWHEIHVLAV